MIFLLFSGGAGNTVSEVKDMNFSDMNFLSVGLRKLLKIRHGYVGGGPPKESKEETKSGIE